MAYYKGFSTVNRRKKFLLTDFELAKQDLINHLHIKKGEKLMNPNFGTIIWGLLFEPMTPDVKTAIADDLKAIISYDPRLSIDSIDIVEFEHGIQVTVDLTFVTTDQSDRMKLTFDKNAKT